MLWRRITVSLDPRRAAICWAISCVPMNSRSSGQIAHKKWQSRSDTAGMGHGHPPTVNWPTTGSPHTRSSSSGNPSAALLRTKQGWMTGEDRVDRPSSRFTETYAWRSADQGRKFPIPQANLETDCRWKAGGRGGFLEFEKGGPVGHCQAEYREFRWR